MGFVPGPGQAKVNVELQIDNDTSSFGFWVLDTTSPQNADLDGIGLVVDAWVRAELEPILSGGVEITGFTIYDYASITSPKVSFVYQPPEEGNVASTTVALSTSMVVSLATGGRGRSSRGRIFLPGAPQSAMFDGEFTQTYADDVDARFTALQDNLRTAGYELIVSSAVAGGVDRVARLPQIVTSIVPKRKNGVQKRRRNYGSGLNP